MSHQYTTSVYTRSQTKPSKTTTHEMSLTSGDLTKILEAVGTKQIDQFLTLQKETETFHKTQITSKLGMGVLLEKIFPKNRKFDDAIIIT